VDVSRGGGGARGPGRRRRENRGAGFACDGPTAGLAGVGCAVARPGSLRTMVRNVNTYMGGLTVAVWGTPMA
jgi:hypothetical protein